MERGLIKHFYKRSHAEQILVTFGLAIVLQEIVKAIFGANPISQPMPSALRGAADIGVWLGMAANVAHLSALAPDLLPVLGRHHRPPSSPSCASPPSAWWCAPAWPTARPSACSASTSTAASPSCSAWPPWSPASRASCTRRWCRPTTSLGMDFLVLSFVVVVVGGMGSLPGAVAAGFLLGILQSLRLDERDQVASSPASTRSSSISSPSSSCWCGLAACSAGAA